MQLYARVVTDEPTDKELDYSIPESCIGKVHVGSRVKVPLRSREILATVVALVDTPSVSRTKTYFCSYLGYSNPEQVVVSASALDGRILLLLGRSSDPIRLAPGDKESRAWL